MEQRVTALYFSPTHGTRAYVRAVAAAIPGEHREVDLTRPEERRKEYHFTENDLVILGVPVYYGRVPEVEGLLDGLHGGNTPVILLAVYGNRLIDDALVELSDLCAARGFRTLAAGSFVAPPHLLGQGGEGPAQRGGSGRGGGAGPPGGGQAVRGVGAPGAAGEPALPGLPAGPLLSGGGWELYRLRRLRPGLPGGGHRPGRSPGDRRGEVHPLPGLCPRLPNRQPQGGGGCLFRHRGPSGGGPHQDGAAAGAVSLNPQKRRFAIRRTSAF